MVSKVASIGNNQKIGWLEVEIEPSSTSLATNSYERDFDYTVKLVQEGKVPGRYDPNRGIIQFPDETGTTISYIERKRKFIERASSFIDFSKKDLNKLMDQFCRTFHQSKSELTYVIASVSEFDREALYKACAEWKSVSVTPIVKFNTDNIYWSNMYIQYVYLTIGSMISSVTNGFQEYLNQSPYAYLVDPNNNIYKHVHRLGENQDGRQAFDNAMLKGMSFERGAINTFSNRSIPMGSLHFAVFSTCLLNFAIMILVFVSYPILSVITKYQFFSRYISVDDHPFLMISLVLSAWILIVSTIFTLI